jgi:hypothetical protein
VTNPRPYAPMVGPVQLLLWTVAIGLITALMLFKDRVVGHEQVLQMLLGVCLAAMGMERFSRLQRSGWWKGDLKKTMREQSREEGAAFLVALNVLVIGVACAVASMWHGGALLK